MKTLYLNLIKLIVPPARDTDQQEETTNTIQTLIDRLFPTKNEKQ